MPWRTSRSTATPIQRLKRSSGSANAMIVGSPTPLSGKTLLFCFTRACSTWKASVCTPLTTGAVSSPPQSVWPISCARQAWTSRNCQTHYWSTAFSWPESNAPPWSWHCPAVCLLSWAAQVLGRLPWSRRSWTTVHLKTDGSFAVLLVKRRKI